MRRWPMKLPANHDRNLEAEIHAGYGARHLMRFGWRPGEGLGPQRAGRAKAVAVKQKLDARGIGAEKSVRGGRGAWARAWKMSTRAAAY